MQEATKLLLGEKVQIILPKKMAVLLFWSDTFEKSPKGLPTLTKYLLCPLAILMSLEGNPFVVPHFKALISCQKFWVRQRCGSILRFWNALFKISILLHNMASDWFILSTAVCDSVGVNEMCSSNYLSYHAIHLDGLLYTCKLAAFGGFYSY